MMRTITTKELADLAELILLRNGWAKMDCDSSRPYYKKGKFTDIQVCNLRTVPVDAIKALAGLNWDVEVAKIEAVVETSWAKTTAQTNTPFTDLVREDYSKLLKNVINTEGNICNHTYKSYTGLSESFQYCTKCDEKKL